MQPGPRTIRPHLEPNEARKLLRDHDPAAIVTNSDGELLGIVRIAQRTPEKTNTPDRKSGDSKLIPICKN